MSQVIPDTPTVGLLVPMQSELEPFVHATPLAPTTVAGVDVHEGTVSGPRVVRVIAMLTTIGPVPARRACEALLDAVRVDAVVVAGVAGGVDPALAIGALVVPERVIDHDTGREHRAHPLGGVVPHRTLVTTAQLLDTAAFEPYRDHDVAAVDMEASAVAAVCDERGVPWTVFRAISDRLADGIVDDDVLALAGTDGAFDPEAFTEYLRTHPDAAARLDRLARDLDTATAAVTAATLAAIAAHDFAN